MNMTSESILLRREYLGWSVRGSLCALPSLILACLMGFDSLAQIIAMVLIVAIFVNGFAWASVELAKRELNGFNKVLKLSAWIKVALSVVNLGFGFPDMWLGMISISSIEQLRSGAVNMSDGQHFSAGWTAAITTAQGLLITLLIALIAVAVMSWKWLLKRCSRSAYAA